MSYFDHTSPCCDLDLENSNNYFCMTLQLIMMHHNTEFGYKMFSGLKNIIWITIDILTLRCDLDLEGNNPHFPQNALAYDNLSSDQVWLPKNQQFRRYSRKSHTLIICALTVTLILTIANNFFARDTLAHKAVSSYQVW